MDTSKLSSFSYTPYSRRSDAVVVQSAKGAWFPGVRIENISFPLTITAIQSALFGCMSEGHTPQTLFIERKRCDKPTVRYWTEAYGLDTAAPAQAGGAELQPIFKSIPADEVHPRLERLLEHSHAGYSNFPVAALLETEGGYISGINIETGDWTRGLCAERVAIAKALSYGVRHFHALHVATRSGEYSSPCGACRQVIIEHLPHHPVHLHHADGTHAVHYSSDLLPYSFRSTSLQKKTS